MFVDSPLIELKVAILKCVMEVLDNPKASAQWIILSNIYPLKCPCLLEKWGEQMCNHFLSSLINGYETSASFEVYHSVPGKFTAYLRLIRYKPPILSAMDFLTPSATPGRVWSESSKVTVEVPRLWIGCSMLPWPCKAAKKQVWGWSRGFFLAQNNSSSGRGLAKPAQCHLLFDPPLCFRSTFRGQAMPAAERHGMNLRKTLPDSAASVLGLV